jgi:hypothetical protein
LNGGTPPAVEFKIQFGDELNRSATVGRPNGAEEHWQFLYDCWRRTDEAKGAAPPN